VKPDDYPPQDPFNELGRDYHEAVCAKSPTATPHETRYGSDPYQSVAVFEADAPTGEVLVFGHGGGWTNGYKEWMAFMAPALGARGVTFVSVGYRLAPTHLFPSGVEDWCDALAWVYQKIDGYRGDRDRIFVGGHSAGGHYSSLLAVRRDWQASRGLPDRVIRGCLPVSGVYDFADGSGLSMRPRFLGASGSEREASPIHNLQGTPPPFFLVHGEKDFPHLSAQALRMEVALRDAGCDVTCRELAACDHLGTSYASGEAEGPWIPAVVPWMRAH
jgi:acetyl esterase/lipase